MKKKIIYTLTLVLVGSMFLSCSEDQANNENTDRFSRFIMAKDAKDFLSPENQIVLKDRQGIPWSSERPIPEGVNTKSSVLQMNNIIGSSYKIDEEAYLAQNVVIPLINVKKFQVAHPQNYIIKSIPRQSSDLVSFISFNSYESFIKEKSYFETDTKGGFGSFSASAKTKLENTFSTKITNEDNKVFGKLSISFEDSVYSLISNQRLKYYRTKVFAEELAYNPPRLFAEKYGEYFVTNFSAGGYAEALYMGTYSSRFKEEEVNKSMSTTISASYASNGGNLGFGSEYTNKEVKSDKITNIQIAIRTLGGNASPSFSVPQDINGMSVDLSGWINSINNRNLHTVSCINKNGLKTINYLIPEINLQKYFNTNRPLTQLSNPFKFEEPSISLILLIDLNTGLVEFDVALITRYTNAIPIFRMPPTGITINDSELENKINEAISFTLQKYSNYNLRFAMHTLIADSNYSMLSETDGDLFLFYGFLENNCKIRRFIDKDTGITYLYNVDRNTALTIYHDRIYDLYSIRDYVNKFPLEDMPTYFLDNCKIFIAL